MLTHSRFLLAVEVSVFTPRSSYPRSDWLYVRSKCENHHLQLAAGCGKKGEGGGGVTKLRREINYDDDFVFVRSGEHTYVLV